MAKRKNATALFEVIHSSRVNGRLAGKGANGQPQSPAALLRTPRWWFKGMKGRQNQETAAPAQDAPAAAGPTFTAPAGIPAYPSNPTDPTANVTAATLLQGRAWPGPAPAPATTAVTPAAPVIPTVPAPLPGAEPAPAAIQPAPQGPAQPPAPFVAGPSAPPTAVASPAAPTPWGPPVAAPPRVLGGRKAPMQLAFDGDRQEMTVRVRYTTALVSGFAVLVVVGLAYILGRHMSEGPQPARAAADKPSTAQVKKGPAQPKVMDLSQRQGRTVVSRTPEAIGAGVGPTSSTGVSRGGPGSVDAPILSDGSGARRTYNLNYLMIQSYPSELRGEAYKLRDFLTANGIGCTVEKSTRDPGAPKIPALDGFYVVVGTRGFPPGFGENPDYKSYKESVVTAMKRSPSSKSKVINYRPEPFKWQG